MSAEGLTPIRTSFQKFQHPCPRPTAVDESDLHQDPISGGCTVHEDDPASSQAAYSSSLGGDRIDIQFVPGSHLHLGRHGRFRHEGTAVRQAETLSGPCALESRGED